jgi:hypothetical protein
MQHDFNARTRSRDDVGIADVSIDAFDERRIIEGRKVFPGTGRQVVEYANAFAGCDQRSNDVRTDEPGSAGHEVTSVLHVG